MIYKKFYKLNQKGQNSLTIMLNFKKYLNENPFL
jgi:hypothetical protein